MTPSGDTLLMDGCQFKFKQINDVVRFESQRMCDLDCPSRLGKVAAPRAKR
jgi:hypothetical protein